MRSLRKSRSSSRFAAGVLLASFAVVAVVAVAALVPGHNTAGGNSAEPPRNDRGQTYGIMADGLNAEKSLDLITAVATNGQEGYVTRDDLDRASGGAADSPEDAVLQMNRMDKRAEAAIASSLGLGQQDPRSGGDREFVSKLWQDIKQKGFDEAIKDQRNSRSDLVGAANLDAESMRSLINDALSVSIPVYSADGETVVGEFVVGKI